MAERHAIVGPMLSERERDNMVRNAEALSWGLAPGNDESRKLIRRALIDAYMAGVRRDAAQPRTSV